jgi:hypothetical protein
MNLLKLALTTGVLLSFAGAAAAECVAPTGSHCVYFDPDNRGNFRIEMDAAPKPTPIKDNDTGDTIGFDPPSTEPGSTPQD